MKHYLYCLLGLSLGAPLAAHAQSVGIGTTAPASSAALEVSSTSKGLLLPRLSTAQMNALAAPVPGLLIYNTTLNKFYGYGLGTSPSSFGQPVQNIGLASITPGQSFTAPASGGLSEIGVYFSNGSSSTLVETVTWSVYAGAGTASVPLLTQTQEVILLGSSPRLVTFTLPANSVMLTAGQQYTVALQYANAALQPMIAGANPYAGGTFYSGATPSAALDLAFTVSYLPLQWVPLH
ncbi:hypothetical protein LJ737_09670 [Hymenobacter sp. 15J16-1T3B]|uniref:hypothetical protein n=1 Tax=Hymenobacter sp. 15J16-1T3B TaxID=2886941 RepID=UPI001D121A3A|nr:hypothetical protein [Hymenobacter sp. 15J16-1T3B]MCC3157507.1 hypothetical protein [Hymenobacter sp. 15J16-1T3B]